MNDGQEKVIFGLVIILIAIVLTLSTLIITIMKLGERVDDLEQNLWYLNIHTISLGGV